MHLFPRLVVRDLDLGHLIFLFSDSKFFVNVIFKVSMSTLFHGKLDLEQRTVSLYRVVLISHPSLVLPFLKA